MQSDLSVSLKLRDGPFIFLPVQHFRDDGQIVRLDATQDLCLQAYHDLDVILRGKAVGGGEVKYV